MFNGLGYNRGQTGREFNTNVIQTWEQRNRWQAEILDWVLRCLK